MLGFVVGKHGEEVRLGVGAGVILENLDQFLIRAEMPAGRPADQCAPAVDEVDQVAQRGTGVLADGDGKVHAHVHAPISSLGGLAGGGGVAFLCGFLVLRLPGFWLITAVVLRRCVHLLRFSIFLWGLIDLLSFLDIRGLSLIKGLLLPLVHRCFRADDLAASDQPLTHQGGQDLRICLVLIHQQVALSVDDVRPDLIGVQRRPRVKGLDAGQLTNAVGDDLSFLYVLIEFQHVLFAPFVFRCPFR